MVLQPVFIRFDEQGEMHGSSNGDTVGYVRCHLCGLIGVEMSEEERQKFWDCF
jgi:hypothetical protein